ncbi:hypothetical protein CTAYLR_010153 [Chrysophaeum taylorii]|uniref:Uncharacterized protein n=1 Tax=Chrysophaeum taylorii TaxID=2483200 RepID=A0AAD7U6H3_9STRA|nr:hypothetical protein CTAYLR_010153 [Chrysophaeum taylorii]
MLPGVEAEKRVTRVTRPELNLIDSPVIPGERKWGIFKRKFGKSYASPEEEAAAFAAFLENDAAIVAHNAKPSNYSLGHNAFSDMRWAQFREERIGGYRPRERTREPPPRRNANSTVPDSIDWVALGAVTGVKDQGSCGSCWAFSTTGSLEGAYQIASGKLVSLSEQMLVDCDTKDDGCEGGLMDDAFAWIDANGGICAEADYSYAGVDESCSASCVDVVSLTSYDDVAELDEEALKEAVAQQPVSVAIEADKSVFQLYSSGVLDSTACGTSLDHGVLIVGYGTLDDIDYWKVKNSWGASWGLDGYVLIARGENVCGIAAEPSYPSVAADATYGAAASHYGDPYAGTCLSDEITITIEGVSGEICAPTCSIFSPCPTDVPSGVVATPECALEDVSSGQSYCALICSSTTDLQDLRAGDSQCGTDASCKSVSGVGVCTYDS